MITFCCTCGRGVEGNAANEVEEKLNAEVMEVKEGRVFFQCRPTKFITKLKTVEKVIIVAMRQDIGHATYAGSELLSLVEQSADDVLRTFNIWKNVFAPNQHLQQSTKRDIYEEEPPRKIPASISIPLPESQGTNVHSFKYRYRVSVKGTGKYRKLLDLDGLAGSISEFLTPVLVSTVIDRTDPHFTVNLLVSEGSLLLGIPVSLEPLSMRNYIHTFGLRSTICAMMARLGSICPGDVVLDPMCGHGTLIIEAACSYPDACYIGSDLDNNQLVIATKNIAHFVRVMPFTGVRCMQIFTADVTKSPFQDSCIDVIISDLPFGKKHQCPGGSSALYIKTVSEMSRLLKPLGRAVLLTSCAKLSSLINAAELYSVDLLSKHVVSLGRTDACIVILQKPSHRHLDEGKT